MSKPETTKVTAAHQAFADEIRTVAARFNRLVLDAHGAGLNVNFSMAWRPGQSTIADVSIELPQEIGSLKL